MDQAITGQFKQLTRRAEKWRKEIKKPTEKIVLENCPADDASGNMLILAVAVLFIAGTVCGCYLAWWCICIAAGLTSAAMILIQAIIKQERIYEALARTGGKPAKEYKNDLELVTDFLRTNLLAEREERIGPKSELVLFRILLEEALTQTASLHITLSGRMNEGKFTGQDAEDAIQNATEAEQEFSDCLGRVRTDIDGFAAKYDASLTAVEDLLNPQSNIALSQRAADLRAQSLGIKERTTDILYRAAIQANTRVGTLARELSELIEETGIRMAVAGPATGNSRVDDMLLHDTVDRYMKRAIDVERTLDVMEDRI